MTNGEHGPGCHLKPGNHWRECVCAQIHPTDRPCVSCEGVQISGETCTTCFGIHTEMSTKRAQLPETK